MTARPRVSAYPSAVCAECEAAFIIRNDAQLQRTRRGEPPYCTPKCGSAARARASSATVAATNRRLASQRMRVNNPMRSADTRARMAASLRASGHRPKIRGGNGAGATRWQAEMRAALDEASGERWGLEHVVTTGWGKTPGPTHYKIDVANAARRIAVEVDGASHNSIERRRSDARKDEFLRSRGWTVHRVTNDEVEGALADAVARCLA